MSWIALNAVQHPLFQNGIALSNWQKRHFKNLEYNVSPLYSINELGKGLQRLKELPHQEYWRGANHCGGS